MTLNYRPIIDRLLAELLNTVVLSRIAALRTLNVLLKRKSTDAIKYIDQILPPLLKTLNDDNDDVINRDLDVIVILAKMEDQLEQILSDIIKVLLYYLVI